MPADFKQNVDNLDALQKAARLRVQDEPYQNLSARQVDNRVSQYLQLGEQQTIPRLIGGSPMLSFSFREFLKDTKFFIALLNGQSSGMEFEVRNNAKKSFGLLSDILAETLVLESILVEEEIKLAKNWTTVHYNNFIRSIDFGLDYMNKNWIVDFKSEHPFLPDNIATILPNAGITLPLRERVAVPIVDARLICEETDMGDSKQPILSNSPRNVFLKNRIFRHVIICREFDNTSKLYNRTTSFCTFQLQLPNIQLVNHLTVVPVGGSNLRVEEITYLNESGETQTVSSLQLDADDNTLVLFNPIRTKYLRVKFSQFVPVTKTQYNVRDWRVKELNNVLRGAGWSQLLDEKIEQIEGRVFDFSIECIETGLYIYDSLGVFRSQPIDVTSPLGLEVTHVSRGLGLAGGQHDFGVVPVTADSAVLPEFYVGVDLQGGSGNTVLRDLIPVPDSYPDQREYLVLAGDRAKVKLFPDLTASLVKFKVLTATAISAIALEVVTTTAHGFLLGDVVSFLAPGDSTLNADWVVKFVAAADTFEVHMPSAAAEVITENSSPATYVYDITGQPDPITVYKQETAITVGTDYQVSFDGGRTFTSSFLRGQALIEAMRDAQSGRFLIQTVVPQPDQVYWVSYKPVKDQKLGKTNLVTLKNGRVVFDKSLRDTTGTITTVVVLRSDNGNQYITPVIDSYSLKVREQ